MLPVFLLATAVGIIAVVLLFLFWRSVDRRVQLAYGDETVEDLMQRLEQALEQQQHLVNRVEHLETIIASEPWNPSQTAPPLALPDEESDAPSEERASRRQQSR